jgi:hypothetical protein
MEVENLSMAGAGSTVVRQLCQPCIRGGKSIQWGAGLSTIVTAHSQGAFDANPGKTDP